MRAILLDIPETKQDYSYLNDIDIVQVIELTGTHLHKIGSLYGALCPLHNDKDSPSLRVYPKTNSWSCFSPNCGNGNNGGNVVEFVKQRYGFNFHQVKDWLESNFVFNPIKIERKIEPEKKKPVFTSVNIDIVKYWHSCLDTFNKREFFNGRGFSNSTIDFQLLGYDPAASRYTIPVWDDIPQQSEIVGMRKRKAKNDDSPKYVGFNGINSAGVYSKYSCFHKSLIVAFAGELDCLRAIQDGIPAFSMVNGANAFKRFPDNWPNLWFPDSVKLAVCFDKKEEIIAGQLAEVWNKAKGDFQARIMHYPINFSGKDYCDWRDSGRTSQEFFDRILALF